MRKEPPCGACPRRGCGSGHDTCKEYQEWRMHQQGQDDTEERIKYTWRKYRDRRPGEIP